MTHDRIAFRALIGKATHTDLLRGMLRFAPDRMMELEADGICGAGHGERMPARANHRNGYRDRLWETRAGAVDLRIPNLARLMDEAEEE